MNKFKKIQYQLLICLLLITVLLVPYYQLRHFDFAGYDDELYVTENDNVQEGLTVKALVWAFTTCEAGNWHPLTWLSHMLDCELYGLNPGGHHWTNVQFHIANTLLLFFVFQLMTGALWRSAFVAALFALHPLHVESVAWVAERKDVLSSFFGMLTLLAYCGYVKRSSLVRYFMVILFLCLGLTSKPMLVTLPFLLLLLDFWPLERLRLATLSRLVLEKIPLLIPVVISSTLTFMAQQSSGAVKSLESFSLKARIANAFVSYTSYVVKAIWPHNLTVFYPHPGNTLSLSQVFGAILLVGCASFLAIRYLKKYPYIAVGLFWYLGTLVPVIGLVQVGQQAMADRYTYIPMTGLFIIVSWGAFDLLKKWHYHKIILTLSAAAAICALAVCSFLQLGYWKNSITLFEHAIEVTDKNWLAYNNLGVLFLRKGNFDKAVFQFDEALKIKPLYADALYNKGCTLSNKGEFDKAAIVLKELLKIRPNHANAHNEIAYILFVQGEPDEAVLHYRNALRIKPDFIDAYNNLANVLFSQEKLDDAVFLYKEALRLDPESVATHYNIGLFYKEQGELREAMTHLAEAIKIDPKYAKAYNDIGVILFQQGKYKKAGVFFLKAINIKPDYKDAVKNLGIVKSKLTSE